MKSNDYMNLCLDQASRSPLHYRHGCVIVRGGKVIGQGFNDCRTGFDGGSLKNGRIASGAFDGPAIAELKQKLKVRQQEKHQQVSASAAIKVLARPQKQALGRVSTLSKGVATKSARVGQRADAPFTMHAEMMAVHSALSSSAALSSTTLSSEKACFKLPSSSKRAEKLRREALEAYARQMCQTSTRSGKLQVQECGFEPGTSRSGVKGSCQQQQSQQGGGGGHCNVGQHESGVLRGTECSETTGTSEPEEETQSERERERERERELRSLLSSLRSSARASPQRPARLFWETKCALTVSCVC